MSVKTDKSKETYLDELTILDETFVISIYPSSSLRFGNDGIY